MWEVLVKLTKIYGHMHPLFETSYSFLTQWRADRKCFGGRMKKYECNISTNLILYKHRGRGRRRQTVMKLGEKIKQTFGYIKTLWKTHPITFIVLILATACSIFNTLINGVLYNAPVIRTYGNSLGIVLAHFLLWFILLIFGVFFAENVINRDRLELRLIISGIFAVATFFYSSILSGTLFFEKFFDKLNKAIGNEHLSMITIGYIAILFLLSVFLCYERLSDRFSFPDYLKGVLSGSFLIGVIYCVVLLGIVTLTFVFTELLFGDFEDILEPLFCLVTGMYLGGAFIATIANSEEEVPKFVNVLFCYVLYGMSLIAYVIVYLYIIKILVFSKFPSNTVFAIITSLFCFSIPLAYLNSDKESGFIGRISRLLPYVFAPLMILQAYTVFARISQYGLTPSRYLGIAFIFFEIVYILWYLLKRDKLKYILLFLAGLVFVLTLVPGSNALSVPKFAQEATLKRLLSEDVSALSMEDKKRLRAAAEYLRGMDGGEEYLKRKYPEEAFDFLKDMEVRDEEGLRRYVDYSCEATELDISGYSTVSRFSESVYSGSEDVDYSAFPIKKTSLDSEYYGAEEEETALYFDATELIELMIGEKLSTDDANEPLKYVEDGYTIEITHVYISYDPLSGDVYNFRIEGFLLSK